MKIPAIKKLVESYDIPSLEAAEEAIINELAPAISVDGDDEGEQLTHVIAALEVHRSMASEAMDMKTALRNYTRRVRKSISI